MVSKSIGARLHLLGEYREGLPQRPAHSDPLRTLAREEKPDLAHVPGYARHQPIDRLAALEGLQTPQELLPLLGDEDRPVSESRTIERERRGDLAKLDVWVLLHEGTQARRLLP